MGVLKQFIIKRHEDDVHALQRQPLRQCPVIDKGDPFTKTAARAPGQVDTLAVLIECLSLSDHNGLTLSAWPTFITAPKGMLHPLKKHANTTSRLNALELRGCANNH